MEIETIPHLVAVDASARERAARVLPDVAAAFGRVDPGPMPNGEGHVLTCAVNVGLNHWILGKHPLPPSTIFVPPKQGEGVRSEVVHVEARDLARATMLSERTYVPLPLILSAACCTGLHTMLGSREVAGPFERPEDHAQVA